MSLFNNSFEDGIAAREELLVKLSNIPSALTELEHDVVEAEAKALEHRYAVRVVEEVEIDWTGKPLTVERVVHNRKWIVAEAQRILRSKGSIMTYRQIERTLSHASKVYLAAEMRGEEVGVLRPGKYLQSALQDAA